MHLITKLICLTLADGAAGGLLALIGAGPAAAKRRGGCRLVGADCAGDADCCSGHCCDGTCCNQGSCPAGQTRCGKTCRDLSQDPANCGACGAACPHGAICRAAVCSCPEGTALCRGACVDTRAFDFDPNNCGARGSVCPPGQFCSEGSCGVCRQLGDDCAAGADCCQGYCNQGSCDLCPADTVPCNGVCVNIVTDVNNCGACGHGCAVEEFCCFGGCGPYRGGGCCPGTPFGGTEHCTGGGSKDIGCYGVIGSYGICCPDSSPTASDGFGYCCVPGVSCLGDPSAPRCPAGANHVSNGGEVCYR